MNLTLMLFIDFSFFPPLQFSCSI